MSGAESRVLLKDSDNLLTLAKELNKALKDAGENSFNEEAIVKYSKGKYNKHTWYSEVNTLAMQWRNNSTTKVGDATIIHKNMSVAILFEATESGYVEISRGLYENLRDYYEQTYRRATDEIYGNLEGIESNKGRDIWNLHLHEDRRDDDGGLGKNEDEEFQIREKRNNEHSGGSGEESLNNGSMKYSYGDESVDFWGVLDPMDEAEAETSELLRGYMETAGEILSKTRGVELKEGEVRRIANSTIVFWSNFVFLFLSFTRFVI